MPDIDAEFICHRLAIHKEAKPVAQRKWKVGDERREAIVAETQKLLNAGFIREVRYTTWLANVVLVKKNSRKWRMCVDYTDLNKACPKDSYPLPNIDRLVDGASGHALLNFLDAYSGYNQIMMYPPDEVHTSFITDHANYCYRVMPFDLKNAGATYQRLMDKVFHQQIGRNMEVYVDDMVVWTLHVDGSSNSKGGGADIILEGPNQVTLEQSLKFGFKVTNNQAEYEALLAGLRLARDLGARRVSYNSDSKLMVEQRSGTYQAKDTLLFGIPHALVTDNGRQFITQEFEDFLHELGIKHLSTSVEHPQTNGQAEAANKVILRELKKRLGNAKGQWPDELPSILWAYHCTPQSTTQETRYRLTYGADAMIPVEIGEASHRRQVFSGEPNDLDLVDELRDEARIHEKACKLRASSRYNTRVKPRSFRASDLVWRLLGEARKDTSEGKLAPTWGGPFHVTEDLENGAYRLEELSGKPIPRTWNATHLKFYFS
uniref:Transposon Ty3-I Gag-Pol polyprotein n=1 Tax=Cajanus cajan TaxID=3821 RepID=A0A151R676_CAJCA|nr:Transposon Ty3-I Gag-Pol polyprotein [Cajanus cajan]